MYVPVWIALYAVQLTNYRTYYSQRNYPPPLGCEEPYKECKKTEGVVDWAVEYELCSNAVPTSCRKRNSKHDYNGDNIVCDQPTKVTLKCSKPDPVVCTEYLSATNERIEANKTVWFGWQRKTEYENNDHRLVECKYDIATMTPKYRHALREKYRRLNILYPDMQSLNLPGMNELLPRTKRDADSQPVDTATISIRDKLGTYTLQIDGGTMRSVVDTIDPSYISKNGDVLEAHVNISVSNEALRDLLYLEGGKVKVVNGRLFSYRQKRSPGSVIINGKDVIIDGKTIRGGTLHVVDGKVITDTLSSAAKEQSYHLHRNEPQRDEPQRDEPQREEPALESGHISISGRVIDPSGHASSKMIIDDPNPKLHVRMKRGHPFYQCTDSQTRKIITDPEHLAGISETNLPAGFRRVKNGRPVETWVYSNAEQYYDENGHLAAIVGDEGGLRYSEGDVIERLICA